MKKGVNKERRRTKDMWSRKYNNGGHLIWA